MKVIEAGHIYELSNKHEGTQIIKFFKDLPNSEESHDGILGQELMRAFIDRMLELFSQKPATQRLACILSSFQYKLTVIFSIWRNNGH